MFSLKHRFAPLLATLATSCGVAPRVEDCNIPNSCSPSGFSEATLSFAGSGSFAGLGHESRELMPSFPKPLEQEPSSCCQNPAQPKVDLPENAGSQDAETAERISDALLALNVKEGGGSDNTREGNTIDAIVGAYMLGRSGAISGESPSPVSTFGQIGGSVEIGLGPLADFSFAASVRPETEMNGDIKGSKILPLTGNFTFMGEAGKELGIGLTTSIGNTLYKPIDSEVTVLPCGCTGSKNEEDGLRFSDGVFSPSLNEHSILGVSVESRVDELRARIAVGLPLRDGELGGESAGYVELSLPITEDVELKGTVAGGSEYFAADLGAWIPLTENNRFGVNAYRHTFEDSTAPKTGRQGAELRFEQREFLGISDLGLALGAVVERTAYPGNPDGAPGDTVPPFFRDGVQLRANLEYRITPETNLSLIGIHGDDGERSQSSIGMGISIRW